MLTKAMDNGTYSPTQLLNAVGITDPMGKPRNASIGMGLDALNRLAKIPNEFDGNCDGLDALCYHLNSYTVIEAIDSLQKVLKRFEELA